MKILGAIGFLIVAAVFISACGDADSKASITATGTATATAIPTTSATTQAPTPYGTELPIGVVAATRAYLATTGLVDHLTQQTNIWQMTDPVGCMAAQDFEKAGTSQAEQDQRRAELTGKVCIAESTVSGMTAQLTVGPYSTDATFKLILQEETGGWLVTSAEYTGF